MIRETMLALIFAASAAPALGAVGDDGNEMLRACDIAGTTNVMDYGFCIGRIDGFSWGYEMKSAMGQSREFCIPEQVRLGQKIDVYLRYLRQYPERRHAHWQSLLLQHSLNDAWPCTDGRKIEWASPGAIFIPPVR